jgi:lysophospholipase L1-like esterase
MTSGGGTRSKADTRARRLRWAAACGALALIVVTVVALGLPEFSSSPVTPRIAPAQGPEAPSAPERGATPNAPTNEAVETAGANDARETKTAHVTPRASKLAPLYDALLKVESAGAAAPVTILHLGDSHIASDRITGEVRRLLQARFGDAGRGLMMPGFPFPYYRAPGFSFEKTGKWTAGNSLNEDGVYGITGVSLTGSGADAVLKLASTTGPFTAPEVSLLADPGGGHAVISAGDRSEEVATGTLTRSVLRVRLPVKASSLEVAVKGDGPVTVLGLSAGSVERGVRYVNLGIPSASALTTRRFDRALSASDIGELAPKLVVLGYGTNEGFIDGLDLDAYEKEYVRLVELVKAAAPDAALLILGPLDGTRLPGFVKGDARAAAPCRPLSASEQSDYDAMLAKEDPRLARWHEPPKLAVVRSLLARIADRYNATYWDLSSVMGGLCSIDRWVKAAPPLALPDHVHLSDEGSRRVGQAIYAALIKGYDRYREQAAGSSDPDSVADDDLATPERVAGPPVPAP